MNAVTANLVAGGAMESLAARMPAMDARLRVGRRFIVTALPTADASRFGFVDGGGWRYI